MKNSLVLLSLFLVLTFLSCKKDEDLVLNPVPYIEIESVSPTTLVQFQQSVRIVLTYDDQDGDLGFQNPDSMSVFVSDSRLDSADLYHIPPLAPLDHTLHIKGTIAIDLQSPFLLGSGASEIITYSIRIKDRAGNYSNTVQSPPITINK